MSRTAIVPTRQEDFAEWYQQVIHNAELAENSPVRGCMVIKPYGYAIWENIQRIFDARLKKIGVQNAYFPLLTPLKFLSQEAEHIEGFAKECAVVTHHRLIKDEQGNLVPDGKLASPYVIRPTSEAIIGHVISKWIKSYRDLPLKLNQWCNVMRWEIRPRLFLRTSEFLWQEGHTVFETAEEARKDAELMLDIYYQFITGDLLMPGIKGFKTEEERFPGAQDTYTVEVITQDGKALQAATSHYLGQSFSKAFNIKFLGRDGKESIAYTASWGISTRLIGALIMSHADDDGLVLPPYIAPYQVVIIPIINDAAKATIISNYCHQAQELLEKLNIRVFIDFSESSGSSKSWKWIKKGAPIRLEVGMKEIENNTFTMARRDLKHTQKTLLPLQELNQIGKVLQEISNSLWDKALDYSNQKIVRVDSLSETAKVFAGDFKGLILINKAETDQEGFLSLSQKHALSRRCIPYDILQTSKLKAEDVLVGKSY